MILALSGRPITRVWQRTIDEKFNLAKRGYALADIYFDDGSKGLLLYLKLTLTDGMPADIYGYKSAYPDFPAQSTADQFFNEKQFEAYRELGYQLCKQMFRDKAVIAETEHALGRKFEYGEFS